MYAGICLQQHGAPLAMPLADRYLPCIFFRTKLFGFTSHTALFLIAWMLSLFLRTAKVYWYVRMLPTTCKADCTVTSCYHTVRLYVDVNKHRPEQCYGSGALLAQDLVWCRCSVRFYMHKDIGQVMLAITFIAGFLAYWNSNLGVISDNFYMFMVR